MPSKSSAQRRYIFSLRGKYKNESSTPEDFKWIWDDAYKNVEEEYVYKPDEDEFRTPQGSNIAYESKAKTYKPYFEKSK